MPYRSVSALPPNVKKAPLVAQRQWMHVFNSAYAAAKKAGKSDDEAEDAAFKRANGVLKKRMGWRDTMPSLSTLFGKKTKSENGVGFPAAAYAYVGDPNSPDTWKVRLWESPAKKETAHQIGMAVAAIGKGFRGNEVEIPAAAMASVKRKVRAAWKRVNAGKSEADMPDAIKMSVAFSVTDDESGAVFHWGKLFEPGVYADKGFSLTVDELEAAIAGFAPVPLKAGHPLNRSQLDGKMGSLVEVEKGEDDCLYGLVEFPGWLDTVLGDAERTVSTEWHPYTKQLVGLSLVTNPRVEDATLFAAFAEAEGLPSDDDLPAPPTSLAALQAAVEAQEIPVLVAALAREDDPAERTALIDFAKRHDTREGQRVVQDVHDTTGRYGAVCQPPSASMASQHEADVMQKIHDLTVEHGATCSDIASQPSWMYGGPEITAADPPKEEPVSKFEQWFAKTFGLPADWKPPEGEPAPDPTPDPQPNPVVLGAPDPEKTRLQEENARLQAQVINTEAKAYSDSLLSEGKILPNEQERVQALFAQARMDDARMGPITFADGKPGTRLDIVKAGYDVRPTRQYDLERLPVEVQRALVTLSSEQPASAGGPPDAARLKHLMSLTPTGQAHLKAMNGSVK